MMNVKKWILSIALSLVALAAYGQYQAHLRGAFQVEGGVLLLSDAFTDTDSTAITAHTPDVTPGGSYLTYDTYGGAFTPEIISNAVTSSSSITSTDIAVFDVSNSNVTVESSTNRNSVNKNYGGQGIAFRWDTSSGNGYIFDTTTTAGWRLLKYTAGVESELVAAGGAVNLTGYYPIKVVCNGSSIKCYYDSVLQIDTTDSTWIANTEHGVSVIYHSLNACLHDDLTITSI